MTTLLLTFGFMLLLVLAMAVGVLAGRKPIKGSCGGLQNIGLKGNCEICGGDLEKCEETDAGASPQRAAGDDVVGQYRPDA